MTDPSPAVEVGEGARELQDPVIAARRKAQPLGGVGQQPEAGSVRFGDLLDEIRRRGGVAGDALEAEARIADELDRSRRGDPRATSAEPSRGAGAIRSAADTDGTSITRSKRSISGPERRPRYWATQRSFGARLQAYPGSLADAQRHGFIAAMSWNRAG